MNNNLLQAVNFLVDKKKVEADIVFDALEMVLLTAYKKEMGSNAKTSIKKTKKGSQNNQKMFYQSKGTNIQNSWFSLCSI